MYKYNKYIRFSLVGFYGISTIVGYLMKNPVYTGCLNIQGISVTANNSTINSNVFV